jgi:DNA primase
MSEPVESLLTANNLSYTISNRDFIIKCLNPDHDDSNPSLRVDRVSGVAHCFACGWKRNLFKHYNIIPPVNSIRLAKLKDKIRDLKLSTLDLNFPEGYVPFNEPIRGISVNTLRYFEAGRTSSVDKLQDRIIFPIREISGRITAFVARHTLSNSNPRYLTYPEHCVLGCYPVKFKEYYTSIVLVEGIFDMLNLFDKGLRNVVCTFGTQTLKNNTLEKLLHYRSQGITKIYILYDGDDAGKAAAKELQPLIESVNYAVEIIDLPDDMDPGDLTTEYVQQIKNYIS